MNKSTNFPTFINLETDPIMRMTLSADRKWLVILHKFSKNILYLSKRNLDLPTQESIPFTLKTNRVLHPELKVIALFELSFDGKYLGILLREKDSSFEPGTFLLFDLENKKEVQMPDFVRNPYGFALSPTENQFFLAYNPTGERKKRDFGFFKIDSLAAEQVKSIVSKDKTWGKFYFTPDGKKLLTIGIPTCLYDLKTEETEHVSSYLSGSHVLKIENSGTRVIIADHLSLKCMPFFRENEFWTENLLPDKMERLKPEGIDVSEDNRLIALAGQGESSLTLSSNTSWISIFNGTDGKRLLSFVCLGKINSVHFLSESQDGQKRIVVPTPVHPLRVIGEGQDKNLTGFSIITL